MSKYAQAAINAVALIRNKTVSSPVDAWDMATSDLFGEGTWGHKKGCPRNAFLGLCEAGLVREIPHGLYNSRKNSKNKDYALKAVEILKQDRTLVENIEGLWKKVLNGQSLSHNYQMEVVCSLWKNNLLEVN